MLKLSNQQTNPNQQTDRAKTICPRYRYQGHKKTIYPIYTSYAENIISVLYITRLFMHFVSTKLKITTVDSRYLDLAYLE